MKKISLITVLCLIVLVSCAKKNIFDGLVGNPRHLSPETLISESEDTVGCSYKWTFLDKPEASKVDVLKFQPNSTSFYVWFVPDVEGEYLVECSVIGPDDKEKEKFRFNCVISEDTTQTKEQIPEVSSLEEDREEEIPEDIPGPVYDEDEKENKVISKQPEPRKPVVVIPKKPNKSTKGKSIPKLKGKYTIQLSSWKEYSKAEKALAKLNHLDLDAYIQKAYFKESNETWYRVRSGSFDSFDEAKIEMKRLKRKLPKEEIWIDSVRKD